MGAAPDSERTRWDRRSWIVLGALALLCSLSSFWLVHPWYEAGAETNDASMYVLSAQSLLRGEGYAYLEQPMIIRPPGMSLLLAPLLAWRGLDFAALNALVGLFAIAGTLLFYAWLRPRTGALVAGAAALVLWLNPGWRHFSNQLMSDVPGAALLAGLLLAERWAARTPSWKRDLVLGLAIGLSAYVRTILVLLVPAILAARALEHVREHGPGRGWLLFARRRALALAGAVLLALAPWSVRDALVAPPPPAEQNFLYSYSTGMLHADPRDPASPPRSLAKVAEALPRRALALLEVLGSRFEGRRAPLPDALLGAWALACVLVLLFRRRGTAEMLFLLVAALLLVYFGFRPRLVLPLFVLALAAWGEAHVLLLARWTGRARAEALVALVLLALALLDFQPRKGWDEIERGHAARTEQARAWSAALGGARRLAANIGWHDSVYLGLPVWSLYFAVKPDEGDGRRADPNKAAALLEKHAIEAVLVADDPADRAWIPWLERRCGPGTPAGRGLVYRIPR